MNKTMQKTWAIQMIGLTAILLLLSVALPRYARLLPQQITTEVKQLLHAQGLPWASVQTHGRDVIIGGDADAAAEQQQAIQTTQSLWYVRSVENAITPRAVEPYTLHLQWNGKTLSASGYVSNEADKNTLRQHIRAEFGDSAAQDGLQTGAGAPDHWATFAIALLTAIKPLESMSVRMLDHTASIAGKAKTTAQIKALQQTLEPLSQQLGFSLTLKLVALDNAAMVCQQEFNRLLSQDKILFASGGSSIDSRSNGLLQELADAAIFCADSTILISGHTDDVGSEADNLKLSEQRAKAVKGWLFNEGGVPLERLKSIGKGATEPLAGNDTEAGRSKNRRIEFTVEGL